MEQEPIYLTHEYPVWREKANFIIHAMIDSKDGVLRLEQLWARRLSENANFFEICCIPFFVYDLALGDKVKTSTGYGKQYILQEIVEPSKRHTFRIWFKKNTAKTEVQIAIEEMDCLLEWQTPKGNLLAVDASSFAKAEILADYLWRMEQQGILMYETGIQ